MQSLNRDIPFNLPIKFLQFGEGNFLRAFIDWQIEILNERTSLNAGVVIVRPRPNPALPLLNTQGGVYTTLIRGLNESGTPVKEYRKISCVEREIDLADSFSDYLALAHNPDLRFIISNTTEAGITINDRDTYNDVPPASFPAKLTRFLHERFKAFDGSVDKGLVLLPCELIDHNGQALKSAVLHFSHLWLLGPEFIVWLNDACTFCSTLVDRIVTGYPQSERDEIEKELGYHDAFVVAAEYFYLFVIEGPQWLADELKLEGADLNIQLVDDITPYKQRKVGVLNGSHTTLVPVALLSGLNEVGEAVADPMVGKYIRQTLDEEIIPALSLPRSELDPFAFEVLRRFGNPFIHHRLESIALNSWSKYAARVLPQLLNYQKLNSKLPDRLVIALAATMELYRGNLISLSDDAENLDWFRMAWTQVNNGSWTFNEIVRNWLANETLWGQNLNTVPNLTDSLTEYLKRINVEGITSVLETL